MKRAYAITVAALVIGVKLTACGGGGVGGGFFIPPAAKTYAVGGTVAGLSGSGLVLQNNGADDLAVSANGVFTFATKLADGGTYLLTVKTQPASPDQTCTASSNAGTISGANVTNISVVCSTNSYSVGGTISGVTGAVVLRNNNTDDLSISSSGSFTFITSVADGAGYSVTVKTKPIGRTCVVTSGTGTVSGADVTGVIVTCTGSNADLSSLIVSHETITPVFISSTKTYASVVSATTTSVDVIATTFDAKSTMKINGTAAISGASQNVALSSTQKTTEIPIEVTAEDLTTMETYTLDISRCDTDLTACGFGTNAYCTNITTDPNNCGACNTVCSLYRAQAGCVDSTCTISFCNYGYADCDGNAWNGCETSITTVSNCGACGNICALGQSCNGTSCGP